MTAADLEGRVRALAADRRWARQFEVWREIGAEAPRYGNWPSSLAPQIAAAAARLGIDKLYAHQSEAISAALDGAHVVTATSTASGKSLCYLLPILQTVLQDGGRQALLLFPTKALAHDQLAALRHWDEALPEVDLVAEAYDGDTPPARRRAIRERACIVLSNPDMLHASILPHHTQWASLFESLRWVVLDEMHVYRGVFGSHVANVLRRLRRVARFYGSEPRFLMTSATIANPDQLGSWLCGARVRVVDADGAPRGQRTFAFYNPPLVDAKLNLRRSPLDEAEALARHFLAAGIQTIVFAPSRQTTELLVRSISDAMSAPTIRGYRAGYTPGERRGIEAALRDGRLRGVAATNALELGVDIGELDACVMVTYPGTIASTWQQAGRAGRRGRPSVAILVAGSGPLDQYLVRHPEYFFGRTPEHARLDADNLLILLDHIRCAAFELAFRDAEVEQSFGALGEDGETASGSATDAPPVSELLAALEASGAVRHLGSAWYWLGSSYPASAVSLRSAGAAPVDIVLRPASEPAGGSSAPASTASGHNASERFEVLGTIERAAAPITVHPGAIYLHDGAAYAVESLDWDAGRAIVSPADGATYTRASSTTTVEPIDTRGQRRIGAATAHHGTVEVRSRATGYRQIAFRTHETLGWGSIELPESRHVSGGYWVTLEEPAVRALERIGQWQPADGERGPNWPAQRDRARRRDGYVCQVCGAPERAGRQHDVHHVRPYRLYARPDRPSSSYLLANELDNLITLCPACHRRAERTIGLYGGLTGLGFALSHIAPLFLMCDSRDLGVLAEGDARWSRKPTIMIYERAAAGVGFGELLYSLHEKLLAACLELIAGCPCAEGCPSCVGPPGEETHGAKEHAIAVLRAIGPPSPDEPADML